MKRSPVGGEAVEVGRGDLAPVAPDVREPHVVGHDENDVGRGGLRGGREAGEEREGGKRSEESVGLHLVRRMSLEVEDVPAARGNPEGRLGAIRPEIRRIRTIVCEFIKEN